MVVIKVNYHLCTIILGQAIKKLCFINLKLCSPTTCEGHKVSELVVSKAIVVFIYSVIHLKFLGSFDLQVTAADIMLLFLRK